MHQSMTQAAVAGQRPRLQQQGGGGGAGSECSGGSFSSCGDERAESGGLRQPAVPG